MTGNKKTSVLSGDGCARSECYVIRPTPSLPLTDAPSRFVFLDRDGVINAKLENDYVKSPDQLDFIEGSLDAVARLNRAGYRVVVVSNQSGISRGLYTISDLDRVTERVVESVQSAGGQIDAFYYCPHRDEDRCTCRKPKPGLLVRASQELAVCPASTYMIGDSDIDIMAARSAGFKAILIASGPPQSAIEPTHVVASLAEAVDVIIKEDTERKHETR